MSTLAVLQSIGIVAPFVARSPIRLSYEVLYHLAYSSYRVTCSMISVDSRSRPNHDERKLDKS
jgi:hypothetical protein